METHEFMLLQDLVVLEEGGVRATTQNLEEFLGYSSSKKLGYTLRSLERRGLAEVAGRVHGGARRWRPTESVRDLLSA